MGEFFTPVGVAALILSVVGIAAREWKDRPRIKRIEDDRELDRKELTGLREANAGLRTMVTERMDFTRAVEAMSDMVKVVKDGIETGHQLRSITTERLESHSRATSEEHTMIVANLKEQNGVLKEQTGVLRDIRDFMGKLTAPGTAGPAGATGAAGRQGERGEKGDHGQAAQSHG